MATGLDCAAYCKEAFEGFDFEGVDIDQLLSSPGLKYNFGAACPSPPMESRSPLVQQQSLQEANPTHPTAHGALPWQALASMPAMPSLAASMPGSRPAQPLPQLAPASLGRQLPPQQHPALWQQQQEQQQQQALPPEQAPPGMLLSAPSQTRASAEEQQQRCKGLLERYWRLSMLQRQDGEAAVLAGQPQHPLGSAALLVSTPCPPNPLDQNLLRQGSNAASLQHSVEWSVAAPQQQQWQQQQPRGSVPGSWPHSVPPPAPPPMHPQQSAGAGGASSSAGGKCQPLKGSWSEVAGLQPIEEQPVSGARLGDWARLVAASLEPTAPPGPPQVSNGGSASLQAAAPAGSDWLKGGAAGVPLGQGSKEAEAGTIDQHSQAKLSIDEQKQLRRREHARASRARMRVYIKTLEQQNEELRQEATRLRRILHAWASQGFVTAEQAHQFLVEKFKISNAAN